MNDAHKVNTGMINIARVLKADLIYSTIVSVSSRLSVLSVFTVFAVFITALSIAVLLIRIWDD